MLWKNRSPGTYSNLKHVYPLYLRICPYRHNGVKSHRRFPANLQTHRHNTFLVILQTQSNNAVQIIQNDPKCRKLVKIFFLIKVLLKLFLNSLEAIFSQKSKFSFKTTLFCYLLSKFLDKSIFTALITDTINWKCRHSCFWFHADIFQMIWKRADINKYHGHILR